VGRKPGVTAAETRAKLLDAAAEVFAEQGYDGARVSEIARRAGLSTGAIYAHYPDKAALLAEAVRTHTPDELSALLARGDADDMLDALRTAGRELGTDDGCGSLVLEGIVAARRDPDVARLLTEGFAHRERLFTLALRRMRAAGLVDATLAPEAVARICSMMAIGGLALSGLGMEDIDDADWAVLVDRLVTALAPAPTDPPSPGSFDRSEQSAQHAVPTDAQECP
jgi:AcrR family transcriptional regulator